MSQTFANSPQNGATFADELKARKAESGGWKSVKVNAFEEPDRDRSTGGRLPTAEVPSKKVLASAPVKRGAEKCLLERFLTQRECEKPSRRFPLEMLAGASPCDRGDARRLGQTAREADG